MLCVVCTLVCVSALLTVTFIGGTALAATHSSGVHAGRDWQMMSLDDVFAGTVVIEDSVSYMPTTTDNQGSNVFSVSEVQSVGDGVVLLSHQLHPLHSGRSLRLAHV